MNGMHDMGGMQTFGAVPVADDGEVFHADWEGRVLALSLILPAQDVYNLNEFRDRRERIPPPQYLAKSYFDLWLTSMEALVVEKGLTTRDELAERVAAVATGTEPASGLPGADEALAPRMMRMLYEGLAQRREGPAARWEVGQRVRARDVHPPGHIRMPRYVRGRVGTIDLSHGCFDLPDASARGETVIEPLYTVRFDAAELWGPQTRPGDGVRVDLWESYLEAPEEEVR